MYIRGRIEKEVLCVLENKIDIEVGYNDKCIVQIFFFKQKTACELA